jgi:hypothetical protein
MATGVCALLGIEAGEVADLVAEALGFALDFVAGVTFFGDAAAVFFAGLEPAPALGLGFAVSRETSGINAPKPRPKLCLFAISLTLSFTFSNFTRGS